MKKVIIAGSRSITDYEELKKAIIDSKLDISFVISGGANGVDKMGERYARENKDTITGLWIFKADWDKYGKKAGHIRNKQMAEHADALIALWDGTSPGTKDMIQIALKKRLYVYAKNVITQQVSISLDDNPLGL